MYLVFTGEEEDSEDDGSNSQVFICGCEFIQLVWGSNFNS